MTSSPDSSPGTPEGRQISHDCQNGDGNLADMILVNLTDSTCDILCHTCLMMMMVQAFRQVTEQLTADDPDQVPATT